MFRAHSSEFFSIRICHVSGIIANTLSIFEKSVKAMRRGCGSAPVNALKHLWRFCLLTRLAEPDS